MKRAACLLFAAVLLASTAASAKVRNVTDPDAPRNLPDEGPVAAQWTDPAEFSDLKFSGNRWEAQRGNWVFRLAEHLRKSAARQLPEGERMEVTITDIDRAGHYEPMHGLNMQHVRIMREIYPPSMSVSFVRYDASGNVVGEGERRLRDMSYLQGPAMARSNDNLRYEKQMIDDWLRSELSSRPVAGR